MANMREYIEKYSSEGFKLFDNNSDKINEDERLLIAETLEKDVSINKFLNRFNLLTPNCKEVVVIERIVDIDDAFTNTLQFILDKTHARFYTCSEIVCEFSKRFFMNGYNIDADPIDIDKSRLQSAEAINNLADISDNIRRFISFKEGKDSITYNRVFGIFRFIKL